MKKYLLLLITTSFLFQACQRPEEKHESAEDVTQQAMSLMQKGQNDAAIEILQQELKARPGERTRILLASAYASRANIKVESYWGFIVGYDNLVNTSKLFQAEASSPELKDLIAALPEDIRLKLKELNSNLIEIQKIQRRLLEIPKLNAPQHADILSAVNLLSESSSEGGRLYRAILEVILLKAAIDRSWVSLEQLVKNTKTDKACPENFKAAIKEVDGTYSLTKAILADVLVAYPSQKSAIENLRGQVEDSLGHLNQFSSKVKGTLCTR